MINSSEEGDQIWVKANYDRPTNFERVHAGSSQWGVKSYLMKLCTAQEENTSVYTITETKQKVRIPKYSVQLLHSESKKNPPVFLVLQIL